MNEEAMSKFCFQVMTKCANEMRRLQESAKRAKGNPADIVTAGMDQLHKSLMEDLRTLINQGART